MALVAQSPGVIWPASMLEAEQMVALQEGFLMNGSWESRQNPDANLQCPQDLPNDLTVESKHANMRAVH